jgi:hypothetical protein
MLPRFSNTTPRIPHLHPHSRKSFPILLGNSHSFINPSGDPRHPNTAVITAAKSHMVRRACSQTLASAGVKGEGASTSFPYYTARSKPDECPYRNHTQGPWIKSAWPRIRRPCCGPFSTKNRPRCYWEYFLLLKIDLNGKWDFRRFLEANHCF